MSGARPLTSRLFRKLRHPAVLSLALHLALLRLLSPGHDDEHTVQWFEGIIEIGEPGDGHAERLHYHSEKRPQRLREPVIPDPAAATDETAPTDSATPQVQGEPMEVATDLSGGGAPGQSGTPLTEEQRYLLALLQRLDSVKTYPRESLLREEEASLTLMLVIRPDGSIESSSLSSPSPFVALNRAAMQAVSKLGSLPPLPASWNRSIRVRIPISYRLEH